MSESRRPFTAALTHTLISLLPWLILPIYAPPSFVYINLSKLPNCSCFSVHFKVQNKNQVIPCDQKVLAKPLPPNTTSTHPPHPLQQQTHQNHTHPPTHNAQRIPRLPLRPHHRAPLPRRHGQTRSRHGIMLHGLIIIATEHRDGHILE